MKFAKKLDRDHVPEWREKYFDYKEGKKRVKAVAKAVQRAQGSTPALGRHVELPPHSPPSIVFDLARTFSHRSRNGSQRAQIDEVDPLGPVLTSAGKGKKAAAVAAGVGVSQSEPTLQTPITKSPGSSMQYGSFSKLPSSALSADKPDFALPGPAIKSPLRLEGSALQPAVERGPLSKRLVAQRSNSMMPAVSRTPHSGTMPSLGGNTPRGQLTRLFSVSSTPRRSSTRTDIGLQNLDQVREREIGFFKFMDDELDKIEKFYRSQEDKATKRLGLLREQLHEMRNRRTEEVLEAKRKREQHRDESSDDNGKGYHHGWIDPIKSRIFRPGPNSKALQKMTRTPVLDGRPGDERRDYVRRSHSDVPYRTAKRKLKLALQEFYRGLELLKSYALLNRTAFRKLNKKYDKAVNARPPYRYMNEKVNGSWFVTSDVVDGHIKTVEDLYARYFEKGNHKIAAGKLRNLSDGPSDTSGSTFLNGLLIGVGSVFAVQGLIYGAELLFSDDPVLAQRTNYLLQIYGGYFLCWYLFTLFCLCARVWTANKVNYHFIFEFDPRNQLDWRELSQFPSIFWLLLGFIVWLNFSRFGEWEAMYLYWPVVLIFVTSILLLIPAPVFYHRSRQWFVYSVSRLMVAGLYPVEFRDFFLGDMFCSLTYAMCNIELFFCLYANSWNFPEQCNSSHSVILGILGGVPPFWRALQCIRRYYDTRNAFPHLANCGKYSFSILAAVFLSVFRIHGSNTNLALFVTFATINSIYCSLWDILMDVSLISGDTSHFLLRDILGLKSRWPYYVFLVVDPILRFSWIFYAIFRPEAQHSTIVSFMIAFAEVSRRALWTIFRVENEHCANVRQYKASRDVPLPYTIEPFIERLSLEASLQAPSEALPSSGISARTTGAEPPSSLRPVQLGTPAIAPEGTPEDEATGTVRRRVDDSGRKSIRRVIAEAHKQDFEKKRMPPEELRPKDFDDAERNLESDGEDDDDDDDDDDEGIIETGSVVDERMEMAEVENLVRKQAGEEI